MKQTENENSRKKASVLIAGASFAGLTMAYWMNRLGYQVTIVEIAAGLKKGGTPVDIKDQTIDIVKRMGLFDEIKRNRLQLERWEFKNAEDRTQHTIQLRGPGEPMPDDDFEIERNVLLQMMYDKVKNEVAFIFNNSITALKETDNDVEVIFKDASKGRYTYVFGCDGIHSSVRKIWFGDPSLYVHFLGQYFSIAISKELLIEEHSLQLYAEPNKGFMLNAYNHKTDIVFIFRPEEEIRYDYRDTAQIKTIVSKQMEGMGWRAAELKAALLHADSFYFDKFCQVKMPSWTKGRVALAGDAAYCASPAAGMGGSLAIIGATALADAFEKNGGDYTIAFEEYNKTIRPFINDVQASAIVMLDQLLPHTEDEVQYRNTHGIVM